MPAIDPIFAPIVAAIATIITGVAAWIGTWVNRKIAENEAINAEISQRTAQNAEALAKVSQTVETLHALINGRLTQLLDRTAELGQLQAALAHMKGIEAGKSCVPTPDALEAVEAAKLKLIEAAADAKRILAEAATAAKEAIDRDEIIANRNRRSTDIPEGISPEYCPMHQPVPDA